MNKIVEWPRERSGLGLSPKEAAKFFIVRAILSLADPHNRALREAAAYEFEVSQAYQQATGRQPRGGMTIAVPPDVLNRGLSTVDGAGGYTIATNLLAQSFIDLLRNRMVVARAGATMLTGLTGDVVIPRQTATSTAYWVADGMPVTESTQAFDQVPMAPKTVGACSEMTRKLLLQSSIDIEALVRRDLANVLGLAVDLAALHGAGGTEPAGLAGVSGIGSVVGGTNGGAPTWADIVNLESEVAVDSADGPSCAYVLNARTRSKLLRTQKVPTYGDKYIWEPDAVNKGDGIVNGYRALVSNQVASNLEKGGSGAALSAIFFGNWADLLIGMWGGIDILVDPYTHSTSGTVRIVAFQDVDVAVRHPESFAAMQDVITTG